MPERTIESIEEGKGRAMRALARKRQERDEERRRKSILWLGHRTGSRPPWTRRPDAYVHTPLDDTD